MGLEIIGKVKKTGEYVKLGTDRGDGWLNFEFTPKDCDTNGNIEGGKFYPINATISQTSISYPKFDVEWQEPFKAESVVVKKKGDERVSEATLIKGDCWLDKIFIHGQSFELDPNTPTTYTPETGKTSGGVWENWL